MEFEKLKHVDRKRKLTVHGFIRNNFKHHVPDLIINACILFYNLFIDSKILTDSEEDILINMMVKKLSKNDETITNSNIRFNLLYRMSRDAKDGNDTDSFHKICDDKGPTLIIIQSKEFNHVFGGYSNISWSSRGGYKSDPLAFLFLVRSQFDHSPQIFEAENGGHNALFHHENYGFNFGGGALIHYTYDGKDAYCARGSNAYHKKSNELCGGNQFERQPGVHPFNLEEYEVYQIFH